jgi:DNA polymerase I - 3''-5'' exonuclease and polymerase domains
MAKAVGEVMVSRFKGPPEPKRIHVIDKQKDVLRAVRRILRFDVLGFDTETEQTADRSKPAFDPTEGARMRLSQWGCPNGDVFVFDHHKVNKDYLYDMFPNVGIVVMQNGKFDLKFVMYELGIFNYGPIWDTMIAEQVLAKGNLHYGFGLDKIADRRCGVWLPKDEQRSDWWMNELAQSQIEYAARDASILIPIFESQKDALIYESLVMCAELEFDTVPCLSNMELNGMRLNKDKWRAIFDKTSAEVRDLENKLWKKLCIQKTLYDDIPTINLNSKPQVKYAFEKRGIKLPLDKKGNVTTSNKLLGPVLHHEEVRLYIEWVKKAKRRTSYGLSWLDNINPYTGRIHTNIKQLGAETGRMSTKDLMLVPSENSYRNCFEAEPGWVFVDSDYSQCELRILAELSRDPNLLKAFDEDHDLHRYSAHLIYRKKLENVLPKERAVAKNLNFGIVYGIGRAKFAADAEISMEEAERIMDFYLKRAYPDMGDWLEGRARDILYSMQGRTLSGRTRRYVGDLEDKEFRAKTQRNAKNLPIQGGNADITKRALALAYKEFAGDKRVKLILPVHDEIIMESVPSYAREAEFKLNELMLKAEREFLKRVKCKVDSNITLEWCKEPTPEQIAAGQAMLN